MQLDHQKPPGHATRDLAEIFLVTRSRSRFSPGMDLSLFASTFVSIFLAEMGDKTQLATLAFAGSGSSRWVVFAASALALVTTSAIAVLAGGVVSRHISPVWIKRAAGVMFLVLGVLFLMSKGDQPPSSPGSDTPASAQTSAQ